MNTMLFGYFQAFEAFVSSQNSFEAAIYILLAKILSGITFIPGTPFTVLSGAMLGVFWGTAVSVLGNLLGSVGAFFIARYLFKDFVQHKILKKYPKINEYEDKLFKDGMHTVIILRLIPVFPYNFLNFALAVTEVRFKDYILGSFIGMIPGTVLFVYFGESLKMLSPLNIFLSLFFMLIFFVLGKFWK